MVDIFGETGGTSLPSYIWVLQCGTVNNDTGRLTEKNKIDYLARTELKGHLSFSQIVSIDIES